MPTIQNEKFNNKQNVADDIPWINVKIEKYIKKATSRIMEENLAAKLCLFLGDQASEGS